MQSSVKAACGDPDALVYQGIYRTAVRESELLTKLYLRYKDSAVTDAIWSGSWELKRKAAEMVLSARSCGCLLTMFVDGETA